MTSHEHQVEVSGPLDRVKDAQVGMERKPHRGAVEDMTPGFHRVEGEVHALRDIAVKRRLFVGVDQPPKLGKPELVEAGGPMELA